MSATPWFGPKNEVDWEGSDHFTPPFTLYLHSVDDTLGSVEDHRRPDDQFS